MKKSPAIFLFTLLLVAFVTGIAGSALSQQPKSTSQQQTTLSQPADNAALDEKLRWIETQLKRYGAVRVFHGISFPGQYDIVRFHSLQNQGCQITYTLSHEDVSQTIDIKRGVSNVSAAGRVQWSVNLAELDPARVEVVTRKDWKGGFINFVTADGRKSVGLLHPRGTMNSHVKYSHGGFTVNDTNMLEGIASALREAIGLCRN
jgi:hypothetical protein